MKFLIACLMFSVLGVQPVEANHHKKGKGKREHNPATELIRAGMKEIANSCRKEIGAKEKRLTPEERKKMGECIKRGFPAREGIKAAKGELPLVDGRKQERPQIKE